MYSPALGTGDTCWQCQSLSLLPVDAAASIRCQVSWLRHKYQETQINSKFLFIEDTTDSYWIEACIWFGACIVEQVLGFPTNHHFGLPTWVILKNSEDPGSLVLFMRGKNWDTEILLDFYWMAFYWKGWWWVLCDAFFTGNIFRPRKMWLIKDYFALHWGRAISKGSIHGVLREQMPLWAFSMAQYWSLRHLPLFDLGSCHFIIYGAFEKFTEMSANKAGFYCM